MTTAGEAELTTGGEAELTTSGEAELTTAGEAELTTSGEAARHFQTTVSASRNLTRKPEQGNDEGKGFEMSESRSSK